MSDPVIVVNNLTKYFGDFLAVDHVSFDVLEGEIVGYLGPNGSGKTTTIRMLLGLMTASEGEAKVLGFDSQLETEEIRNRCGYMSQKFALYDDLSVWENLEFYGGIYGIRDKSNIQGTLSMVGLTGHQRETARSLSAGWRQRLALGIALVHHPKILFLDEPTSGVDPSARRTFWDLIYSLSEKGVTIVVTTHYMDEAEYCHRIGLMKEGKLLAIDSPQSLKKKTIPGDVWEIAMDSLFKGLDKLPGISGVKGVGLAGDHLRVILDRGIEAEEFKGLLLKEDLGDFRIEKSEPTLEDVFLTILSK